MAYAVKSVTITAEMLNETYESPNEFLFQDPEYREQDEARYGAWEHGEWHYVAINAIARIEFCLDNIPGGSAGFNTITSLGLWNIESDSDPSYFAEVYADEVYDLKDQLKALGIGDELITVRPWS